MTLHMIQLQLDTAGFVRFLQSQRLNRREDEDLGYGAHCWLAATFGALAPRPFRIFMGSRSNLPPKLLGYSSKPHSELINHAKTYAEPFAHGVCDFDNQISSKEMPKNWSANKLFGFDILACPVGRKSRSGIEKDIFLLEADKNDQNAGLQREKVYKNWLATQFETGCELEHAELKGFRLVKQLRRSRQKAGNGSSQMKRLTRPQARLTGTLIVRDGQAFGRLLSRGVGRHRSFGYGMLLLRPL